MSRFDKFVGRYRAPFPLFWYDGVRNFGDLIGPWLIELMTGRRSCNLRGSTEKSSTALLTVGSIIQAIDRPGLGIWGSGLIRHLGPIAIERLSTKPPRRIYGVRGTLTKKVLEAKLGWDTPDVFGDPASLLPRIYSPPRPPNGTGRWAVIPHYIHSETFQNLHDDRWHVIDVKRDPRVVVGEIAHASAVVSTSLHGIICAQAYGVPWTWLRFQDSDLVGGTFKFRDYFSNLDTSKVSAVALHSDKINREDIAQMLRTSSCPSDTNTYDRLMDAFPSDFVETR